MDRNSLSEVHASSFCRICTTKNDVDWSIYETLNEDEVTTNLHMMLVKLYPTVFNESQVLCDEALKWPMKICKECKAKVIESYRFYERCTKSARSLRTIVSKEQSTIDTLQGEKDDHPAVIKMEFIECEEPTLQKADYDSDDHSSAYTGFNETSSRDDDFVHHEHNLVALTGTQNNPLDASNMQQKQCIKSDGYNRGMDPSKVLRDTAGFVAPAVVISSPIRMARYASATQETLADRQAEYCYRRRAANTTAPASTTSSTETVYSNSVNVGVLEPAAFNLPSSRLPPPPCQLPVSSSSPHHDVHNVAIASNPALSLPTPSPPLLPLVSSSASTLQREVCDEEASFTPAWSVRNATPPGETCDAREKRLKRKQNTEFYRTDSSAPTSLSTSTISQHSVGVLEPADSPPKETPFGQKKRLTWRRQALYYYRRRAGSKSESASTTSSTVCSHSVNMGVSGLTGFNPPSSLLSSSPPQLPVSTSSHHEARNVGAVSNPASSFLTPPVPSSSPPSTHQEARYEETSSMPALGVRCATPPEETRDAQIKRPNRRRIVKSYRERRTYRRVKPAPTTFLTSTVDHYSVESTTSNAPSSFPPPVPSSSSHRKACTVEAAFLPPNWMARYASPPKETPTARGKRLTRKRQSLFYYRHRAAILGHSKTSSTEV